MQPNGKSSIYTLSKLNNKLWTWTLQSLPNSLLYGQDSAETVRRPQDVFKAKQDVMKSYLNA